jgi:hypothetical protein
LSGTVNVGTLEAVLSLKDAFSTPLLNALKSAKPAIVVAASIAAIGLAVRSVVKEAMEAEKVLAQLSAGVKSTGGVAGKSVGELDALADSLSKLSAVDDEVIGQGEALLLTFRKIRGEAFDETMKAALDLSARLGGDLQGSIKMLGRALEDPKKGMSALGKAGVQFSEDQKKVIKDLVKSNDLLGAQKIILKEVETQVGGSAAAYRNTMSGALDALGIAWGNLKEEIGQGGLAMRGPIELLISLLEKMTKGVQYANLGFTVMAMNVLKVLAPVEIKLRELLALFLKISMKGTLLNPFASDEQKARSVKGFIDAERESLNTRVKLEARIHDLNQEARDQALRIAGVFPKIKAAAQDALSTLTEEQDKARLAAEKSIDALKRQAEQLESQSISATHGLIALQAKRNAQEADNAVLEIASALAEQNLKLSASQESAIRSYIARAQDATKTIELQVSALTKLNDIASQVALSSLWHRATSVKEIGNFIGELQSQMAEKGKQLTEQMLTAEERRLKIVKEAYDLLLNGNISQETYDRIKLANAESWTAETTRAYDEFVRIQERLSAISEELSYAITSVLVEGLREGRLEVSKLSDAIKDVFLNTLGDIINQWLSTWFKAMASWLARWIATQRMGQVAGGSLQGPTQDGGNLSGVGTAAASKSGMSAGSMAGWALAAYALFVVYKGFVENHKRLFTEVTITNGQISNIKNNTKKNLNDIQLGVRILLDSVAELVKNLNVEVSRLGTVIIESSKAGFNVKMGAGSTGELFKSIEEAMAYAQVLMLKYGEFGASVSALVQSVIKATKAMTPDQLASDIDFARTLENQNKPDLALEMERDINLAKQQWMRAKELFLAFYTKDLPALAESASSIFTHLTTSIRGQFNSLMGIKEDPKKAWQDRVKQFEIEKKLALLQLQLWKQENAARIANYKIQGRIIGGGGGGKGGGPGGGGLLGLAGATLKFAAALDIATGDIDDGLQALLDIQKLIDDAINDINSLPGIDPNKDYPGTGGKGGGQKDDVRQFIKDRTFELSLSGLSDYQRALRELDAQYKTLLEQAGKDKKLRAELLALKEKELALLAKEQITSIVDQFQNFLGLVSPFDQVRKTAADLIKQIEDSPLGSVRKARMIGRILADLDRQLTQLAMQSSLSLLGEMLGDLEKYGVETQLQADMRKSMAILEHTLKMIHYHQEIEILRASGKVSAEVMAQLDAAMKALDGIDPNGLPGAANDNGPTASGAAYNSKMEQMAKANQAYIDKLKSARDLLKKYQDAHADQESQLSKALRQINEDFKTIRESLGNTPEVIAQFNIAIRDAFKQALSGIQAFYDSLTTGENAYLTTEQQYEAAKAEYNRLLSEIQSGDYSELDKLDEAGQEFITLLGQMFGTSTSGFTDIKEEVIKQLREILSLGDSYNPNVPNPNVIQFPTQLTDGMNENVLATKNIATVLNTRGTRQEQLLSNIVDAVGNLADEIRVTTGSGVYLTYG